MKEKNKKFSIKNAIILKRLMDQPLSLKERIYIFFVKVKRYFVKKKNRGVSEFLPDKKSPPPKEASLAQKDLGREPYDGLRAGPSSFPPSLKFRKDKKTSEG